MAGHRIRLNSAWDIGAGSADGPIRFSAVRTNLPARCGQLIELAGADTLVLRRRFHSPSNLQPGQRVLLRILGCPTDARWTLNGIRIAAAPENQPSAGEPATFDITGQLSIDNELILQVRGDAVSKPDGPLFEEVCLVISDSCSSSSE